MHHAKAAKINALLKTECNRMLSAKDDPRKHDQPSRKPAIYRSVGVKVPGNDSLMVVHVTEY